MTLSHEYPKWVHCPGQTSVIVNDAEAEAAQLAAWGVQNGNSSTQHSAVTVVTVTPPMPTAEAPAPVAATEPATPAAMPASNLGDWDSDGRPGGSVASTKPSNALTTPAQPKRGGGWPKGKSRTGNRR